MSMFPYQRPLPHYYGDITRALFVAIGIIMLLGLPKMTQLLQVPAIYPIIAIVLLAMAAGYTSPKKRESLSINIWLSAIGLASFIYISWFMPLQVAVGGWVLLNQIVAILFLAALYFSIKSFRGYSGNQ